MTAEDEGALLPVFRIGRIAGFDLDAPVLVGARQKVCSVLGGDRDRAADTAVTVKGAAAAAAYFDLLHHFRINEKAHGLVAADCCVLLTHAVNEVGDLVGVRAADAHAVKHDALRTRDVNVRHIKERFRKGLRDVFLNGFGRNYADRSCGFG